jgi:hypothetical protein
MTRIAKPAVHAALDRVATNIVNAKGNDPVISRADIDAAVKLLNGTEKELTAHFFRFIDARDASPGARVTQKDVDRALDYAKKHIIDTYDVNKNGLSRDEVQKMSRLGQLAVAFARELKTGAVTPPPAPGGVTSTLGQQIEAAAKMPDGTPLTYMSESDYPFVFVEVPHPGNVDAASVKSAFGAHMLATVFVGDTDLDDKAVRVSTPAQTSAFLARLGMLHDPGDPVAVEMSAATQAMKAAIAGGLTELTHVKVGPKDSAGKLRDDAGLYTVFLVGRTAAGALAGVSFGAVET